MSKLDDIQTICDNCEYAPALDEICKQRVKALFLELLNDMPYGLSYHEAKAILEKRINDL